MLDDKDPTLQSEAPAGFKGETTETTAAPPVEEEKSAETLESSEAEEEKPKTAPVEDHEIFLEGEEPERPPKDETAWYALRKAEREAKARADAAEQKLQALTRPNGAVDPGPEPAIEDEGIDYDQAKLKEKLRKWDQDVARKKEADARMAEQAEAQRRTTQARTNSYVQAATELSKRVSGYPEAEAAVIAALDPERQDALLKVADDPAKVVYILGQRPDKLAELAKEMDRDIFVSKLKKLESQIVMKEKKGTQPPPPDAPIRGSGSGTADSTLDKLRKEAAETGDYSKVNRHKRDLRDKQRAKK